MSNPLQPLNPHDIVPGTPGPEFDAILDRFRLLNQQRTERLAADPTRQDLDTILARFRLLNDQRRQRISDTLLAHQRDFLHLLPLLFHGNHPRLPGYVSSATPCGVAGYVPGAEAKACGSRLARNFVFRNPMPRRFSILGLYVMGSAGTVAYSKSSDLDIWLCYAPHLRPDDLEALGGKTRAVQQWAATLDLEVHFFLINTEQFRTGIGCPVSKESTGSIQHHLLLEEFYRSSVYVAGRVPIWWLVPPSHENAYDVYTALLRERGLIPDDEYLDFGGMESMTADEFLAASLWHLYKAITSPHKSLLKLLLLESYASEYPDVDWVSTELKRRVYEGRLDADGLDPYLLLYRKLERYLLAHGEQERLELARQSFYLKVHESVSSESAGVIGAERWAIMRGLIQCWGWEKPQLAALANRGRRRLVNLIEEHKAIVRGLRGCYGAIRKFAGEHVQTTTFEDQEVVLIGRLLFAALEKKPGKVDIFTGDSEKDLEEHEFSLHEVRLADESYGWCLYLGRVRALDVQHPGPVKKARGVVEILAWMAANGLHNAGTEIIVETSCSALAPHEVRRILNVLCDFLRQRMPVSDSLDVYREPADIRHVCLLVNIGQEPAVDLAIDHDAYTVRNDPFCYGLNQTNLVIAADRVSITSWHEVMVHHYEGLEGLFECLCDIYNQTSPDGVKPHLQTHCLIPVRGPAIARRVQQLYDDLGAVLGTAGHPPRYVVRGAGDFFLFSRRDNALRFDKAPSIERLLHALSRPVPEFSTVVFDVAALDGSPLPVICAENRRDTIQIFALSEHHNVDLFILDERGSLYFRRHPDVEVSPLLNAYSAFLEAVQRRYAQAGRYPLEYHRLTQAADNGYRTEEIPLSRRTIAAKIDLRVIGQEMAPGRIAYTIYCDDREFSSMEEGRELFQRAAEYVYQRRQSGKRYPVYLSDLDVPLSVLGVAYPAQLQTVFFLTYKGKIEAMLNCGDAEN